MDSPLWLLRGQCSKGLITKDKEKLGEEQVKKKASTAVSFDNCGDKHSERLCER